MSAQRYREPGSLTRMEEGLCPECGEAPESHINDYRFWVPRRCDFLPDGVTARIAQYEADREAS